MEHIYIALVDTPGIFAWMIRKYLKQRYIHVVLSMDAGLREAYSIGRRYPSLPLFAGFERENARGILRAFPTAFYRICELECTSAQKQLILENLRADYRIRYRIHYAVLGVLLLTKDKPLYIKNRYTCSAYVADILMRHGVCDFHKHFMLVTPKDFYALKMRVVYEGTLAALLADESGES